jgi:hypothetical protein
MHDLEAAKRRSVLVVAVLLPLAIDQRGHDADPGLALAHVPAELQPAAKAGHVGRIRHLQGDQHAVANE